MSSGARIGRRGSSAANSRPTFTTAVTRAGTSASRITATGWRTATSRSACCRDRAGPALGDDVPPVLRLGSMVRHDGYVPHSDAAFHWPAGGVGLRGDRDRGAHLTVLPRHGGRPLSRYRKTARRPARGRRCRDVGRLDADDVRDILSVADRVRVMLHAHALAHELDL